jgi:hypothetical protein
MVEASVPTAARMPNPRRTRCVQERGSSPDPGASHVHPTRCPCRRSHPPRVPSRLPPVLGPDGNVDYLLSEEAIRAGSVAVEEVSEGGSVPNLLVTNQGDSRVLFLEGEELRGAKQNRVLNTSVLIAAHSQTPIPVSCVEQGRWRYRTRHFSSGGSHSCSKLRHILKKSAYRSMKVGHGYTSDQMSAGARSVARWTRSARPPRRRRWPIPMRGQVPHVPDQLKDNTVASAT